MRGRFVAVVCRERLGCDATRKPCMQGECCMPDSGRSYWHIGVSRKTAQLDGHGRAALHDIRQAGLSHIEGVRSSTLYFLRGRLSEAMVRRIADELLTDHVSEEMTFGPGLTTRASDGAAIEIHSQPGVMNPVAISTLEAVARFVAATGGDGSVDEVQTARRYEIIGARCIDELETIASGVLGNACIETWYLRGFGRDDAIAEAFPTPSTAPFALRTIKLDGLGDEELAGLSRSGHLFLSLAEMQEVRNHFQQLGRDPTDLELETVAQTWSEHCVHKTLKSTYHYRGDDFGKPGTVDITIDNLLKDTIAKATHDLHRDWCLSVFVDNAGVIAFDDEYGIAFKAETHNHPSAIEPYGGAATGIGGCIRDIMGCGLGAKPIASTDVFCVATPDFDPERLPRDVIHPRRVLKGVVSGVRDYGNRMGIPTVNGAIFFDDRYLANPLVFCGCVGLIPRRFVEKKVHPGDCIVVTGGKTGRDGIHGATFSSAELTVDHADEFSHAVQIGNAVEEKKVLDAMLLARDHKDGCLYSAVTDCGAGGLSSAVGEMGEETGADVDLSHVPLKYAGLRYDEIWISEAQERMVFAVPPKKLAAFLAIFAAEEVEATAIGTFTGDGQLRVRYDGTIVGEIAMSFLHGGIPQPALQAVWIANNENAANMSSDPQSVGDENAAPQSERVLTDVAPREQQQHQPATPNERLLAALGELNTASKEWVIRQYDHEVQGRSVIKSLVGPGFGPSDAAVLRPRYESDRGIAIACGMCPELADVDPYLMAIGAIDEALRNVICVGGDPNHTAILDNFCWPKVDHERSLGALVRTCKGAYDAAVAYGLPFVSGKDSLNNQFSMTEAEAKRTGLPQHIAIPYTLLISALAMVDDVTKCVSMDLKIPGHKLVLASAPVRAVGLTAAKAMHDKTSALIRSGKVCAAHDISDGGLAVAIAEMCLAGGCGATVDITPDCYAPGIFEPVATTYLLEMNEAAAADSGLPIIGTVEPAPRLRLQQQGEPDIDLTVSALADAWRRPITGGGGSKP